MSHSCAHSTSRGARDRPRINCTRIPNAREFPTNASNARIVFHASGRRLAAPSDPGRRHARHVTDGTGLRILLCTIAKLNRITHNARAHTKKRTRKTRAKSDCDKTLHVKSGKQAACARSAHAHGSARSFTERRVCIRVCRCWIEDRVDFIVTVASRRGAKLRVALIRRVRIEEAFACRRRAVAACA